MKQLILIKKSESIHLAHLYEHIFCTHITTLFYENHLFQHLDYSLVGKTYHGGVIYIDLELYTKAAISFADQISTLDIRLNKTTMSAAASELLAEVQAPLGGAGYNKVKQALKDLHRQPWQNIDDVALIDTKTIRRKAQPFYIVEGKSLPSRKLTVGILLDMNFARSHRELLPLFRQFAWFVTGNLQDVLANKYAYYSLIDAYKNTRQMIGLFNTFKVAHVHDTDVDLPDNLETCLKVVSDLQQHDSFNRYMTELRATSYYNHPSLAVNLEKNYEDTLIFIGPKGWQQIAIAENCELLLKHMSIELKFGREKVSEVLIA